MHSLANLKVDLAGHWNSCQRFWELDPRMRNLLVDQGKLKLERLPISWIYHRVACWGADQHGHVGLELATVAHQIIDPERTNNLFTDIIHTKTHARLQTGIDRCALLGYTRHR
jgi:hypothetical protein